MHTLKYLKKQQIFSLIKKRMLKTKKKSSLQNAVFTVPEIKTDFMNNRPSLFVEGEHYYFSFIHKKLRFLDWNIDEEPLWRFNLHYFDYLMQEDISKKDGVTLIKSWCDFYKKGNHRLDALHEYPTSLRIANWAKCMNRFQIEDGEISIVLFEQVLQVFHNPETEIQANHLFTNWWAVAFTLHFFSGEHTKQMKQQALKKLQKQVDEQILPDGGHYERSFMYHTILLQMLLDLKNIGCDLFDQKIQKMIDFLHAFSIDNKIPLFNDAAFSIAPEVSELLIYAKKLGFEKQDQKMSEYNSSNFALRKWGDFILHIDGGGMVNYQPGHMHACGLSFELYYKNRKIIRDPGCSTYLEGDDRQYERSTAAHNTISIDGKSQHQLWSAFRVAQRGRFFPLTVQKHFVAGEISHWHGAAHKREWTFRDKELIVKDSVFFHGDHTIFLCFIFDAGASVVKDGKDIIIDESIKFSVDYLVPQIEEIKTSNGFNKYVCCPAIKYTTKFEDNIELVIRIANMN